MSLQHHTQNKIFLCIKWSRLAENLKTRHKFVCFLNASDIQRSGFRMFTVFTGLKMHRIKSIYLLYSENVIFKTRMSAVNEGPNK